MDHCCNDKADALATLRARQGRVLYLVLSINAVMFVLEFVAGWLAQSTALLGDSLDMLGDASVYAVTLYALTASERTRAGIALFKGLAMAVLGLAVLIEAARKAVVGAIAFSQRSSFAASFDTPLGQIRSTRTRLPSEGAGGS